MSEPAGLARAERTAARQSAILLAAAALVVSGLALFGWATGWVVLTQVVDAWPVISPWSASLRAVLALALLLQVDPRSHGRVLVARVLLAATGLVAAVLLVEAVTGVGPSPNRPVPPESAATLLVVAALVWLVGVDRRPLPRLRVVLFVVAIANPLGALLSYVLVGRPFADAGRTSAVSVIGAATSILLVLATVLARPDRPPVSAYLRMGNRSLVTRVGLVLAGAPLLITVMRHGLQAIGVPVETAWTLAVGTTVLLLAALLGVVTRRERRLDADRRAAQSAAIEAERHYRLLAENASDAVFEMSASGAAYTWISPSFTGLLGWTVEDLAAAGPLEIADPRDRALLQSEIARVGAGEDRHFRARYRTKSGTTRWLDVTVRPVFDEAGVLVSRIGSYRDADEAVRLELGLRESEERFRTALVNAPGGVALVAPDGTFVSVNDSLCRILDRSEPTLLATTWQALTHPDDVRDDQELVDSLLAGDRDSYRILKRYLRPDSSIVWGDLSVGCVRDDDGTVQMFISHVLDVTDAHLAAQRLADSEARFRLLAENASDVVCHLRAGRFVWVSPSATATWGADPARLVGVEYADLVRAQDRAELRHLVTRAEAGDTVLFRGQLRIADGSYHWMEAHLGPFRSHDGTVDGAIASVRNVDVEVAVQTELATLARIDALTGLLNRREVLSRLRIEAGRRRPGSSLAVLFCDVDRFKDINDAYGHATGDAVLRKIAERIAATVRLDDVVARIGGDELLVLLVGTHTVDQAREVAEKVRTAIAEPFEVDGDRLTVSVSIGVALHQPGEDVDDLLARADDAMYEAKRAGRDRVVVLR